MARSGGLITEEDLAAYQAVVREPVKGTYRGYDIFSMPPPSSGGAHVIQILNILEGFPIGELGFGSAETIHLMAEAMKRAYADRSEYLGDSDFVEVPLKGLTSKAYAETLRADDRQGQGHAFGDDQAEQSRALRERPDHAFFRRRQGRQRRLQHLHAELSRSAPGWSRRAPASCSTTRWTIFPPSPACRTPMA